MNRFRCGGCGGALYFGNRQCLQCERDAAYLPPARAMVTVDYPAGFGPRPLHPLAAGKDWMHCANRHPDDVCFWLVDTVDNDVYCRSCRLSKLIPDLSDASRFKNWKRVEAAKQWLIHSLFDMGLPVDDPIPGVAPLTFHLLASAPMAPVVTGHQDGRVTLDVAEADDAERARRREALGEPYRTLLGHLRHEVGHFYWTVLAREVGFLDGFRARFGDETRDYGRALKRHYADGPPPGWQSAWITAYASSHPWEDWAECWAHFMHVTDAVQTARSHGLSFRSPTATGRSGAVDDPPPVSGEVEPATTPWPLDGGALLREWHPISLLVNDLNRAVGMPDAYPFVLSDRVRDKIVFVAEQAQKLAARFALDREPR
jgi:hypothetical protein